MPSIVRERELRLPNTAATRHEADMTISKYFWSVLCLFEVFGDDIINFLVSSHLELKKRGVKGNRLYFEFK